MTRYYFDDERRELAGTWDTGVGGRASGVVGLPDGPEVESGLSIGAALAEQLTQLSSGAWRTYTHGGRFVETGETNTEAWRLARFREDFAEAADLIAEPGDPHELPYSPVLAPAKAAGHLLAKIASEAVTHAVRNEVTTELDAVIAAELGDLTGRGAQAVALTRWSSSLHRSRPHGTSSSRTHSTARRP